MLSLKNRSISIKSICFCLLLICLGWGLLSCGQSNPSESAELNSTPPFKVISTSTRKLTEVPPPKLIQELRSNLNQYQPQVAILSPQADTVLEEATVKVQFEVQNLPLFKNENLGLGPYLQLLIDNEPYQAIYDTTEPIVLKNLALGTHTLRVFASYPWHESFKNEGAYAQTTFHILTKTNDNYPNSDLPLLTYNRPLGIYQAEPIMLDFYLTNAPIHAVAQENPDDNIKDWQIRVTVNGESFLIDQWQTVYLKGFQTGSNWVQLELLDEEGNQIENAFNNTVRLVTYEPKGNDTLAKLVTNKMTLAEAKSMVEPGYQVQSEVRSTKVVPTPESEEVVQPEAVKEESTEVETTKAEQNQATPSLSLPESNAAIDESDNLDTEAVASPQSEINNLDTSLSELETKNVNTETVVESKMDEGEAESEEIITETEIEEPTPIE